MVTTDLRVGTFFIDVNDFVHRWASLGGNSAFELLLSSLIFSPIVNLGDYFTAFMSLFSDDEPELMPFNCSMSYFLSIKN